jgi:hypothetical protein
VWKGPEDDRYLSSLDGRLAELIVQATDDIYNGPANSTWARTKIRKTTPATLRVVYWVLADMLKSKPGETSFVLIKWPLACLAIFVLVSLP